MAVIYIDGFDTYQGLAQKWITTTNTNACVSTGRLGYGQYAQYSSTGDSGHGAGAVLTGQTQLIIGIAMRNNFFASAPNYGLYLEDSSNRLMADFRINTNGNVYYEVTGGTSYSHTFNVQPARWDFWELVVTLSTTGTGSFTVYANNVQLFTQSAIQTAATGSSAACTFLRLGLAGQFSDGGNYDDLYVIDPTTGTNTTRIGPCCVAPYLPSANGHTNQWTPSTGSNFSCVNTSPISTSPSKFVSTSTVNNVDTYAMTSQASTITIGSVIAVQPGAYTTIAGAGAHTVSTGISNGSTNNFTAAVAPGSSAYFFQQAPYNTNPFTSAAWAVADLSTLQGAIELVS